MKMYLVNIDLIAVSFNKLLDRAEVGVSYPPTKISCALRGHSMADCFELITKAVKYLTLL